MTIGEKLQQRRKELKLTQEMAARKLHVSRQAISNWENEKNYPDLETMITISDVYQISLDTLLKGDKKIVKKMNKNIYGTVIKKGGMIIGLLGALISSTVDFVINHQLTWSLIVVLSVLNLGIIGFAFEISRTQRLIKTAICLSVLILPYLWLLDKILVANQYISDRGFFHLALPISLLWLVILWVVALVQIKVKWQWSYSLALLCLFSIGANYFTNVICGKPGQSFDFMITVFGNSICIIFFYLLGRYFSNKKRENKS